MATPRQIIADQLIADHALVYSIYPYMYSPTTDIRKPVIAVYRTDVEDHTTAANMLEHSVTIDAYGGKVIGEAVEDELDDLLDAIELSLQRLENVYEIKAKRVTFKDAFHGWTITCTAVSPNVYKSAVLEERS